MQIGRITSVKILFRSSLCSAIFHELSFGTVLTPYLPASLEKPNGSFYSNVYISEVENGAFQPSKVIKSFCSNDNSEEIVGLKNIGGKAIVFKSNLNNEGDLYELSFKNNELGGGKRRLTGNHPIFFAAIL